MDVEIIDNEMPFGGSWVSLDGTADMIDIILFAIDTPNDPIVNLPFSVSVMAKDSNNTIASGYTGTIQFTSTDNQAVLPQDYTFTKTDQGQKTFDITFTIVDTQTLTVTDVTAGISANTKIVMKYGLFLLWIECPPNPKDGKCGS